MRKKKRKAIRPISFRHCESLWSLDRSSYSRFGFSFDDFFPGEAEAFAIEAKAKAEAEMMGKKADAWEQYKDAAMIEMVLKMLPLLAAEVASKMQNLLMLDRPICLLTLLAFVPIFPSHSG